MKLSVPPQGHRSIIERLIRAEVPQLIGKALTYRPMSAHQLENNCVLAFVFLACFGCATCTGLASSTGAANPKPLQAVELEAGLQLRAVARGAYEITHELPWPANSLLVEMADRTLVLVGTPYTPEE
jgi:hypothetical protein